MATLKLSDLSVGDWVRCRGRNGRIECLRVIGDDQRISVAVKSYLGTMYQFVDIEDIEPIPITEEILERNGFEPDSSCWRIYRDGGGHIGIREDKGEWYLSVDSEKYLLWNLRWVHQIQHLMRVWRVDKEINL